MKVTEEQQRLISGWLRSGMPRSVLEVRVQGTWNLKRPEACSLIGTVQTDISESLSRIERPEFLALQMERLETLAVKAQEEGNLAVALGCLKELHELAKLHGS